MVGSEQKSASEDQRILLGLLESVERDGATSQRRLAGELGIALGLVNSYLKRCIQKGLVKVTQVPARRFAYYLTPHGFAEKSRLSLEYLTSSLAFFRRAKSDCGAVFDAAERAGFRRAVLAGVSDLAEIATICARDSGVEIVGVVDPRASRSTFAGLPLRPQFDSVFLFDAVIVTDLVHPAETLEQAISAVGAERVFLPQLLEPIIRRMGAAP